MAKRIGIQSRGGREGVVVHGIVFRLPKPHAHWFPVCIDMVGMCAGIKGIKGHHQGMVFVLYIPCVTAAPPVSTHKTRTTTQAHLKRKCRRTHQCSGTTCITHTHQGRLLPSDHYRSAPFQLLTHIRVECTQMVYSLYHLCLHAMLCMDKPQHTTGWFCMAKHSFACKQSERGCVLLLAVHMHHSTNLYDEGVVRIGKMTTWIFHPRFQAPIIQHIQRTSNNTPTATVPLLDHPALSQSHAMQAPQGVLLGHTMPPPMLPAAPVVGRARWVRSMHLIALLG